MPEKQVKLNQENTNPQNISPICWVPWLVVSIILSAIGAFIMVVAGFRVNHTYGYLETAPAYYFGLILLVISGITSIIWIKEMIAESNVRALEVYYGKRRKVIHESNADDENKTFSFGE